MLVLPLAVHVRRTVYENQLLTQYTGHVMSIRIYFSEIRFYE